MKDDDDIWDYPCSLCGEIVESEGSCFEPCVARDEENQCQLEHSGSEMHLSCLFAWDGVDRFLEIIYRTVRQRISENRYWKVVHQDDRYTMAVNYQGVTVVINHTPFEEHVTMGDYPDALLALKESERTKHYDPDRLELLRSMIDEIVATHPTLETSGEQPAASRMMELMWDLKKQELDRRHEEP